MILEFINTGLVILLISFTDISSMIYQVPDPEFEVTKYNGFQSDWYRTDASQLIYTLIFSSVVSHVVDGKKFIEVMIERFKDRKYSPFLKKYPNMEDDDQPNTQK
jgi:hypothetical protein